MLFRSLAADLRRAERFPKKFELDDVVVMQEELGGLRNLVLEEP